MLPPLEELCATQGMEHKASKKANDNNRKSRRNRFGKGTASAVPLRAQNNPGFSP
jgi:hypothetical protein